MKITIATILLFLVWATTAMGADATVTFTDNSANETGFQVERNLNGGTYSLLSTLAANITQMIDTTLVQGAGDNKYCYRVRAINSAGSSVYGNTATPGVTDCKTIAALITIPNAPSNILVQ